MSSGAAPVRLRRCWEENRTAFGLWISTDAPSSAEALCDVDFDYVVIDLQHGLVEVAGAISMMRAMQRTDATVLCRVPTNEPGIIGRVLDAGAHGVIVPMVDDADLARACVAAAKYAPAGGRSYGPTRARMVGTSTDVAAVNDATIVIPMIETAEAVRNVESIATVPGVDALYVGPSDLSITIGLAPGNDQTDERFTHALSAVRAAAERCGVAPGIHADPQVAAKRAAEGFAMVTVVTDLQAVTDGARRALHSARL
ncbi:MAG: aldolase/citrate lyase family protein [Ilumatobacter sp.]|uniref:HpcH/HpaI aldolase family protein n=1 Tax=Ilumatobacter sp. TaxID=1967498 RepID=UPI00329683B3